MELKMEIPIFKKKELDSEYINEIGVMSYEDMQLTKIYECIIEYGLKPSLEQVSALLEYKTLALAHAHELALLLGGADELYSFSKIWEFVKYWNGENASKVEWLVFIALERLCGEIRTIEQILDSLREPKLSDVEQEQSSNGLGALFG